MMHDDLLKELQDIRKELSVISNDLAIHMYRTELAEQRLDKFEEIVQQHEKLYAFLDGAFKLSMILLTTGLAIFKIFF
jgi:hypothetical protein